ncbi:MAG: hypothetical protein ACPGJV_01940 [Bacteriovoracaceae bacterium]
MSILDDLENSIERPGMLIAKPPEYDMGVEEIPTLSKTSTPLNLILSHSKQSEIANFEQIQILDAAVEFFDKETTNALILKSRMKKQSLLEYVSWALNKALESLSLEKTPIILDLEKPQTGISTEPKFLVVYNGGKAEFKKPHAKTQFVYVPPILKLDNIEMDPEAPYAHDKMSASIFVWNEMLSLSCQSHEDLKYPLLDAWKEFLI